MSYEHDKGAPPLKIGRTNYSENYTKNCYNWYLIRNIAYSIA